MTKGNGKVPPTGIRQKANGEWEASEEYFFHVKPSDLEQHGFPPVTVTAGTTQGHFPGSPNVTWELDSEHTFIHVRPGDLTEELASALEAIDDAEVYVNLPPPYAR